MKTFYLLQIGLVLSMMALLVAPVAIAQTNVQTRLELTTEDDEEVREWQEGDLEVQLQARLCWQAAGGVNPQDGEFNLSVQVDTVQGANATVDPQNLSVAPPTGPTDGEGCTDPQDVTLMLQADEGLGANQTLNLTVTVSERDGEPVGTFDPPEDNSTAVEVMTTEDFETEDPGETDDGDEEPTPAPGAIVFLAALALLLARRRASRA